MSAIFATSAATEALAQRVTGSRSAWLDPCEKNLGPTAAAGDDQTVDVGELVTFDASASSDPDGWIDVYFWDFGDQSVGRGRTVSHAYDTPGTYQVRLTIGDNCGRGRSDTTKVTVLDPDANEELRADFRVEKLVYVDPVTGAERWEAVGMSSDDPIEYGLEVRLNAEDWSSGAAHFRWRQNGALIGMTGMVYDTYEGPTDFDVSLTIYDAAVEQADTITRTVYVDAGMESLSIMPWQESGAAPMSFTLAETELWAVTLSGKLGAVDISDPHDLGELVPVLPEYIDGNDHLASGGGRLYLARQNAGVDVYAADPSSFEHLGRLSSADLEAESAQFVGAVDDFLFVGTRSPSQIQVYDLETLGGAKSSLAPFFKSATDVGEGIVDGWQIGRDAIVIRNSALTLTVVDIRNALNPSVAAVLDPETTWISRAGVADNFVYAVIPGETIIWQVHAPENQAAPISVTHWATMDVEVQPLGLAEGRLYAQYGGVVRKYNVVDSSDMYLMDFFDANGQGLFGGFLFASDPGPVTLVVGTGTSTFEAVSP
ncbi:MAG: PKD domain-containing protein [Phycisphaerae bacterium]